jgi:hypothetical protein
MIARRLAKVLGVLPSGEIKPLPRSKVKANKICTSRKFCDQMDEQFLT